MHTVANQLPKPLASRLLHTMLRVQDLERALNFYVALLGMRLHRREDYPLGRFTLAFVGYGEERSSSTLELTWNWDQTACVHGTAFGHLALAVADLDTACARLAAHGVPVLRPPGPMRHHSPQRATRELIAFVEDPDGNRIELIQD